MKGTDSTPSSLGTLLLGRTRLSILSLLLLQPERRLYLRQILRMTGAGQGAVQRELAKLAHAGILTKTREANLTYYQANQMAPVFNDLKGLVEKTAGIAGFLRTALLPLADTIERAFLFGSIARGEERAESDIDLMVIGDASFLEVVTAISSLQESLGREINPTVFTQTEFSQRLESDDHFLGRLMRENRVDLIGGDREP
ncbi:MAG: nucleotidyltransferase domain-containing protein [Candidatus Bipolaricaulia bacterium]